MAKENITNHTFQNSLLNAATLCSTIIPRGNRKRFTENILVVRLGNVGDIIVAIPAFHAVRSAHPNATITLLTSPSKRGAPGAVEVLQNDRTFDDIIVYYEDESAQTGFLNNLRKTLSKKNIDTVVMLPNQLTKPSNILKFLALSIAIGARSFYGFQAVQIKDYSRKQVDRLMELIAPFGANQFPAFPWLNVTPQDAEKANTLLADANGGIKIGIHCGAKRPANHWPTRHYIALGKMLVDNYSATIILTGGASEKILTNEVAEGIGKNCTNLAGETNIGELTAIIQQCDLFISNDTGIMHVAYASGAKVLAIFGGRYYEYVWYPYGQHSRVIRKAIECSPCHAETCPLYPEPECLARITPEEVFTMAKEMLA